MPSLVFISLPLQELMYPYSQHRSFVSDDIERSILFDPSVCYIHAGTRRLGTKRAATHLVKVRRSATPPSSFEHWCTATKITGLSEFPTQYLQSACICIPLAYKVPYLMQFTHMNLVWPWDHL